MIEPYKIVCPFCGYQWIPRTADVKRCPYCKHYLPRASEDEKLEQLKECKRVENKETAN